VAGIFLPNRPAVLRLVGALRMEQDDEWLAGRRFFTVASMAALLAKPRLSCSEGPSPRGFLLAIIEKYPL
jgi:hypothetical protein